MTAKGAGTETFADADYFAAVETVWCRGKKGVPGGDAVAPPGSDPSGGVGGVSRVGGYF